MRVTRTAWLMEELVDRGPAIVVAELKRLGFTFESEDCPIKFKGESSFERLALHGLVKFQQTVEEEEDPVDA